MWLALHDDLYPVVVADRQGASPVTLSASHRATCGVSPLRASIADAYGPDSLIRACALRLRGVRAHCGRLPV